MSTSHASGLTVLLLTGLCSAAVGCATAGGSAPQPEPPLERIVVSRDGAGFERSPSGTPFIGWGFNYDHDAGGALLEDYWCEDWGRVEDDFREMKALGANIVRIHLQVEQFLDGPATLNEAALGRLGRLVELAEETGLYLDITGLGCYEKERVPAWYDALPEEERWETQALFWSGVARVGAGSTAVMCYDLMNEPVLPGPGNPRSEWLPGEGFGGKHFVQCIALDLRGRSREDVARAWVDKLTAAIRSEDPRALITVGVIPWAYTWPGAEPVFHSEAVGEPLDFVAVHFYPETGKVDKALEALRVYERGKPLVVEETFTLRCGVEDLDRFIEGSRGFVDGYIGFYWGTSMDELEQAERTTLREALVLDWLRYFKRKSPELTR